MEVIRVAAARSDAAEAAMRPYFPTMTFGSGGARQPLEFALTAHAAHGTVLLDCTIVGPSVRGATEMVGFAVTETSGSGLMLDGRETIDSVGKPYAVPHRGMTGVIERMHWRTIQLDVDATQRFARVDLGNDEFDLQNLGTAALGPEAGTLWSATAQYAEDRLLDGSADSPLVGAALSHLLVSTYLASFHTNWIEARRTTRTIAPVSAAVRRAQRFMDEHSHLPITAVDIAEASRLSVRGLQAAFRRERGETPMEYLRAARLAAARQDLLAAEPGGGTVAEIARRWGFAHLGRFAASYRAAFHELPSTTLRR